jgi:DNA-binding NarL/FixJ family response regulator
MRQPTWAAPAFGGAVVAGIAAALISGYKIADCLRFQSKPGECSEVLETNALPLVAGIAAIAGPVAGFMTLNPDLESPFTAMRRRWDEAQDAPPPEADPPPAPDSPEPDADTARDEMIWALRAEGHTQQAIAAQLGISRSTVGRVLRS